MSTSLRALGAAAAFAVALASPRVASAFGGFYVSGAETKLSSDGAHVVLMREGTRTVISMQSDYEGPPEGFAMVVPVPVILPRENIKTLSKDIFDKLDKLTAPRLVEYWEQDPCGGPSGEGSGPTNPGSGAGGLGARAAAPSNQGGVKVEAQFDVGEYDIAILTAKDSNSLDAWLKQENYKIPSGAEPYLRPYVQAGSKFLVARVDPKRLTFDKGRAQLSPLRFHYDATDLTLPVRLGLINSHGPQDLVAYILASQRFESANYPSITIPTNLDLAAGTKEHFGRFYAALFERTLEKSPKAIVTEYAWSASSCEPCTGPTLSPDDLATLGADAIPGAGGATRPRATVETPFGTTPAATQALVQRRFLPRVQACWAGVQSRRPKNGRVDVKLSWTADGKVKDVSVPRNDTADVEVATCIKKIFDGAAMPLEEGSMIAPYTLDLATYPTARPWTITRLHARYEKDGLGEDIVFKAASPIVGGRETRDPKGSLERGSSAGTANTFQGRYAIRHPWIGPIECKEPRRGVWGGPWADLRSAPTPAVAVERTTSLQRSAVNLGNFVRTDLPELDVKAGKGSLPPIASAAPAASTSSTAPAPSASASNAPSTSGGCGIGAATAARPAWGGALLAALALACAFARRRDSVNNC